MTPEEAYVAQYRDTPLKTPVPMTVVSPAVGSQYIGATVRLEFVVDALGKTVEPALHPLRMTCWRRQL